MQSLHTPSDLSVMFDDDHAVANAGLVLAGVVSEKLGLEALCDEMISLAPFPGRRVATLVHSLVIGGTLNRPGYSGDSPAWERGWNHGQEASRTDEVSV